MRRWLWLVPFTLAFAPTFHWFVERWTAGVFRNGHGIFMPFIVGYFAWEYLKQDHDAEPRSSAWGWLFLLPALGLLVLDSAIHSELLSGIAFVLSLPGLALLLLGAKRTRGIAFPLLIAVFMLPIPAGALSRLYMVLRTTTAVVVAHAVPLLGVPLERTGTSLRLPHSVVDVADNCSGFATLYAAILAAIVLAQMTRAPWRRAAVLAAAVPLALVCNFLRVTVLVLLVQFRGPEILDTQIHPLSGMALFVLVIGALMLIAGRDALHAVPGNVRTPVSDRWVTALLAVCALALVPVVLHSYLSWRVDDCANPAALVPPMSPDGDVAAREAQLENDFVDVYQWREGKLAATPVSPELSWVVIRSYDPKQLYYRGTRRMWKDVTTAGDTLEWLDADGDQLPIVRSTTDEVSAHGPKPVIAALLVYEGRPVATGWLAQLRSAPRHVLGGSRPMTMFAVRGDVPEELVPAAEKRARQWLIDSWRSYRGFCGG